MRHLSRQVGASYLRNFIFGVEDSLVSTVGLLSGIAIVGLSRRDILLTGVVLIFVEAFSMAVGSFLAEHSAEDYLERRETPLKPSFVDGLIMFFSYFISGFIPIFPYAIFEARSALWISIIVSLFALFVLGLLSARVSRINILKNSIRMVLVGGVAIAVGVAVGKLVNSAF